MMSESNVSITPINATDAKTMKKTFPSIFPLLVMVLAAMTIVFSEAVPNVAAFHPSRPTHMGEKLTFQIRWGIIQAGEAVLEALPYQSLNGTPTHHFVLNLKTSSAVDIFYKVRDKIESYTDLDISRSLYYRKKAMGKDKKDVKVHFDWENGKASYSNFDRPRDAIDIESGAFDPLSALYGIRNQSFEVSSEISFPITDGKRCFLGRANVVKKEEITINDATYETYLIEPELTHFDGVFKESDNPELKIWFTADERKIPVKIECKVLVGSITGELVNAQNISSWIADNRLPVQEGPFHDNM